MSTRGDEYHIWHQLVYQGQPEADNEAPDQLAQPKVINVGAFQRLGQLEDAPEDLREDLGLHFLFPLSCSAKVKNF